eukprot:8999856-Karenia_brevis.AAC.1
MTFWRKREDRHQFILRQMTGHLKAFVAYVSRKGVWGGAPILVVGFSCAFLAFIHRNRVEISSVQY